jgi:hypothetical protein
LQADRGLAIVSVRVAVDALSRPDERVAGLLTLAVLAEAYGDLTDLAEEAGVMNDPLYRALPSTGVPQLSEASDYESWYDHQLQEMKNPLSRKLA